jgi:hypothetical protein
LPATPARQVRENLAEHTDDPAALQTLLNDPHPAVRAVAAQHPGTTEAQRRQLVHDPAAAVRAAVVYAMTDHGAAIPEEDLLLLAQDRSVTVRRAVAELAGFFRPMYDILAHDPDETVATAARASLLASHPMFHDEPLNRTMNRLRDSS